ncbi:MAG: PHP domain-containing protein, partial [Candidatus Omnitrophica bacterium]|nr:PHP domain-containing protein [Candidatus Omnitrophota bacterium]
MHVRDISHKRKETFADLHLHTAYSDGMFSPEEIVETACRFGLGAVAITDHDCVEGIDPAIEAAKKTGLEIIPGVEISTAVEDKEIHLLGYFMDWRQPALVEELDRMKKHRVVRIMKMVRLLRREGVNISEDDVLGTVSMGTVGRLHLARVMVAAGAVKTTGEAFIRYIADGKPCFVKHGHLDYTRAVDMVKRAGGVPVLGHPGVSAIDEYIPEIVSAGVRGIEVFHPDHSLSDSDKYLRLAAEYSLIVTGGSDCHGTGRGKIKMGRIRV